MVVTADWSQLQLQHVMLNLGQNATKFVEYGFRRFRAAFMRTVTAKHKNLFQVEHLI